jgi:hypothetical protein
MIVIAHWFMSFIVLSVVLARLESIEVRQHAFATWGPRAFGWTLIGLSAFDGIIAPFFGGNGCLPDKLAIIGMGVLAVAYRWEGAGRTDIMSRRASDRHTGAHQRAGDA